MDAAAYAYGTPLHDASVDEFEDRELSQWVFYTEKGDGDKKYLCLRALFQRLNVNAMRLSSDDPYATYSANRYSVKSAVKGIADAAATLHVSKLLSRYNERAKKLFEKSVQSYKERATEEFKDLFREFRSRSHPSGYVLLKPVDAKSPTVSIEGCNVSVSSTNPAKRVRLSSRVSGNECPIVPMTTPELRKEFGVMDGEIPSLGCIPDTDFEVVAGSLSSTFSGRVSMNKFCELLVQSANQIAKRPGRDESFTQLLKREDIITFKNMLSDASRHSLDLTKLLRNIVEICKDRKEIVLRKLDDDYAKAIELYNGDNSQENIRMRDFFVWVMSSPLNTPVFITSNEDRDTFIKRLYDVSKENFNNPTDTEDLVVTVGSLLEMTREKSFFVSIPQPGDSSVGSMSQPFALTEAYNPLVTQPESQIRFKLSLTKFQGLNPSLVQGTDDDNPLRIAGEDNHIDFDDDIKRFEFDLHARDCKGYEEEFRSTMRALAGVLFSTTKQADPDRLSGSGVYDVKKYAKQFKEDEQGFMFVPRAYPETLDNILKFIDAFRLKTVEARRYQDVLNFPTWMGKIDGEFRVSQASLYFWKNAISTVSHPFSSAPDSVRINDVAAIIAMSEPFSAHRPEDGASIKTFMKNTITDEPLFADDQCLHLIQLTSHSMAPGLCDFVQSFAPFTVHFKGAAIKKSKDGKYMLEYSLGTESTIIIESFMIASALVKILTTKGSPDDTSDLYNVGKEDGDFSKLSSSRPKTFTRVVTFPAKMTDSNLKRQESKRTFTAYETLHGYATAFSPPGFPGQCIDDGAYKQFLDLDDLYTNRAGLYCLGTSGRFLDLDNSIPPGHYSISGRGSFKFEEPFPEKPIQLSACKTYADYLALHFFGGPDSDNVYDDGEVAFASENGDNEIVAYVTVKITSGATIRHKFEHKKENPILERVGKEDVKKSSIQKFVYDYTSVTEVAYKDTVKNVVNFEYITSKKTLSLGPQLSDKCSMLSLVPDVVLRYAEGKGTNELFVEISTNRVQLNPLSIFNRNGFKAKITNPIDVKRARDANVFTPSKSTLSYSIQFRKKIAFEKIGEMLRTGCQGYHFSRRDALSRTVFAVAINRTMKDIKDWYEECDGTLPGDFNEPKGVHILNPDPRHKNCAKLLNFILRQEMKGSATLGRMATTGQYLITPVIVNVLGPMESNLLTPCYVDNVFSKTARFRSVEAQIIGLIESHLDMIRRIEVVKGRVRGCLAEHIMRNKPRAIKSSKWMIDKRPETIATMATLFIRVNTYNEISAKTSQGRATTSVAIAYKEIEATLHNLLFKV